MTMGITVNQNQIDQVVAAYHPGEVPMKPYTETQTRELPEDTAPVKSCVHGRLIDDVLTKRGTRTGQVRCIECGAIFDDPHQGSK
jgi:hypothetical protein